MKTIMEIQGMTCDHCVARVTKALTAVPGARAVKVNLKKAQAELDAGADHGALQAAVTDAGYTVISITETKGGFSLFKRT